MLNTLKASASILVDAPVQEVWDALVNPEKIRKYLHNTTAISEWKEGSKLEFTGEWKGKNYTDKGVIRKYQKDNLLEYTWLSSSSGLEDRPENYALVSYKLKPEGARTCLTVTQDNIKTEEARKQSVANWAAVLSDLRKHVEQEVAPQPGQIKERGTYR